MMQDMGHMEVSRVIYVKVRAWDQLEQRKMCVSRHIFTQNSNANIPS